MSISSHETLYSTALPDGRLSIRHRFVDHVAGEHSWIGLVASGTNLGTHRGDAADHLEIRLDQAEQRTAILDVQQGTDPTYLTDNPIHSTTKKVAKKLVYWLMGLKNDPILPQAARWLKPLLDEISLLPNNQIENFLDITSGQRIRMQQVYKDIFDEPSPCATADNQITEMHENAEDWGEP